MVNSISSPQKQNCMLGYMDTTLTQYSKGDHWLRIKVMPAKYKARHL